MLAQARRTWPIVRIYQQHHRSASIKRDEQITERDSRRRARLVVAGIADARAFVDFVASRRRVYDGVDAPLTASMCQSGGVEHQSANSHTARSFIAAPSEAGQMPASDYVPIFFQTPLASRGASADEYAA
jgi:hypothetical protein